MRNYNQPILSSAFTYELNSKLKNLTNYDSLYKGNDKNFFSQSEIRLLLDNYSTFKNLDDVSSVASSSVVRSSFFLLYRGIDLLEDLTISKTKNLLIQKCTETVYTDYGHITIIPESDRKYITFNASMNSIEKPVNIMETDIDRITNLIKTNLACFASFPSNLAVESTYSDGYSDCCMDEIIEDSLGTLIFNKDNFYIKVKIQDKFLTKELLENIRSLVKEQAKSTLEPSVKNALNLLKRAMRRFSRKKKIMSKKIQEYIRKENIINVPMLKFFLKWKALYQNKIQDKKEKTERLLYLQNNQEELNNVKNITIKKLDVLIQESKDKYRQDLIIDTSSYSKTKPFLELKLLLLDEGVLYDWNVHSKIMRKVMRYFKIVQKNKQHKLHLKIASLRSGFINNRKFLEREKWFGFNRNKQLGNMLMQCDIDPNILTIDWNDCIIEDNSKQIKIALSKLCRLTKTKQYLAFCNTSYCIRSGNHVTPLERMFESILGFNNYTYREFSCLLINHIEFVSKNKKGINWVTKYLSSIFDKYQAYLEKIPDKFKCLRWCDITETKLCLDDVENDNQTFIKIEKNKVLTKEEIIAKSYNAGVFKYIKEAIKLIKNRSKVIVKKWKDFCDENDIEGEEIQLINENTIYDRIATELAIEKYGGSCDY